jgi:hypothetical protein
VVLAGSRGDKPDTLITSSAPDKKSVTTLCGENSDISTGKRKLLCGQTAHDQSAYLIRLEISLKPEKRTL